MVCSRRAAPVRFVSVFQLSGLQLTEFLVLRVYHFLASLAVPRFSFPVFTRTTRYNYSKTTRQFILFTATLVRARTEHASINFSLAYIRVILVL